MMEAYAENFMVKFKDGSQLEHWIGNENEKSFKIVETEPFFDIKTIEDFKLALFSSFDEYDSRLDDEEYVELLNKLEYKTPFYCSMFYAQESIDETNECMGFDYDGPLTQINEFFDNIEAKGIENIVEVIIECDLQACDEGIEVEIVTLDLINKEETKKKIIRED